MKIHKDSHLDHGLTQSQIDWIVDHFAARDAFFIESVELPKELGTVPHALYGPLAGDDPVPEAEVHYASRGERPYASRVVDRPVRQTSIVTVIAGPHDDQPCVVYTIYGGPCAPQEPGDPGCKDKAASEAFWSEHALACTEEPGT